MNATAPEKAASSPCEIVARAPGTVRGLFVLNGLRTGGSETKTVRVVNALRRRGLLAGIVSLNAAGELTAAIDQGVPVWHLDRTGKFSFSTIKALRNLIRAQKPDVVFSVNLYPSLYVALATLGLATRPRIVGMMNTSVFARRDAWRPKFYSSFLRRFDAIVYGCEVQRAAWRAHIKKVAGPSTVIYNGVDTDHFRPSARGSAISARTELGIPAQAFVIGSVGRFAQAKNQAVLIETMTNLRNRAIDAHLLLVGEGSLRHELERLAEALGTRQHVTFAGARRDVRPCLAAMDVFVLPSTHVETFSNAALEAMAMSKPVILSRVGGADEMVRDGIDGFVVDVEALSRTLPDLLHRLHADPDARKRFGEAARSRVVECFSLEKMLERYAALIAPDVRLDPRSNLQS